MPGYVKCIEAYRPSWFGLKFKFPLIWLPERRYKSIYKLTKKVERDFWADLVARNGFLDIGERP